MKIERLDKVIQVACARLQVNIPARKRVRYALALWSVVAKENTLISQSRSDRLREIDSLAMTHWYRAFNDMSEGR